MPDANTNGICDNDVRFFLGAVICVDCPTTGDCSNHTAAGAGGKRRYLHINSGCTGTWTPANGGVVACQSCDAGSVGFQYVPNV